MSEIIIYFSKNNALNLIRKVTSDVWSFNKSSWKYVVKNTVKLNYENSLLVYNLTRKQALRLANLLEVEYFLWKELDVIEMLKVDGTIVDRFSSNISGVDEYVEYTVYYPVLKSKFNRKIPLVSSKQLESIEEKEIRFYRKSR